MYLYETWKNEYCERVKQDSEKIDEWIKTKTSTEKNPGKAYIKAKKHHEALHRHYVEQSELYGMLNLLRFLESYPELMILSRYYMFAPVWLSTWHSSFFAAGIALLLDDGVMIIHSTTHGAVPNPNKVICVHELTYDEFFDDNFYTVSDCKIHAKKIKKTTYQEYYFCTNAYDCYYEEMKRIALGL
ncbi:MAG: hypothetical protein IKU61_06720 [Clostridia bacterium]|nr:hypothetical protein [Clostridia bacterium]